MRQTTSSRGLFTVGTLDRFILRELMAPFFFGIMAFSVILVAGSLLFKIADLVIQRGVSLGIVIRLFLYYLPRIVAMTIPMSCLLAALLGFGKLSANSELVALKSAGLSFQRIVRPVVIISLFISIFAFMINESLVPMSERAAANVMAYEVFKESPPVFKEKVFLREGSDSALKRVIYINRLEIKTGRMQDIVIEEFENSRLVRMISAKSGEWINGSWWIMDGEVYEIIVDTGKVGRLFKFDKQALSLNLNPVDLRSSSDDPDLMTITELYKAIKTNETLGGDNGKLWMIFNMRISVPWACVVLALVGAAFGSRPQRTNSSVGLGVSVIIVFIYYVILSFAQSLGEAGYMPPLIAAWLANVVFLIIGGALCVRANRLG